MDRPSQFKAADEPRILETPVIKQIAAKISLTPAQVVLKWAMQQGTSVIPKSVNPGRIVENLATLRQGELSNDDMAAIEQLNVDRRFVGGEFWTPQGSPYTLKTLWDD
jgi:alcohol dehydrogenase (NADP+)